MCTEEVQFGLAASTTLGHHFVCSDVNISLIRCEGPNTLFRIVAKVNQPAQTFVAPGNDDNLVCILRRSNLGWLPATLWATISCERLTTAASTAASDQLYFVWDSSKGKSTGSDHSLAYKRYYNVVCVLRRSNLGRPQAPLWATISCVAM
jgi:hypothetical protein